VLTETEIRDLLRSPVPTAGISTTGTHIGHRLEFFPTLESTNTKARELAGAGAAHGTVVVAAAQTAGRGRQGRAWISEPGRNLLMSIILRPRIDPAFLGVLSLYASVSVAATVARICGAAAGCKWPNDVMVSGKKICGILSESVVTPDGVGAVVLGIGLNVNQENFAPSEGTQGPPAPAGRGAVNATSMRLETGRDHDLAVVLHALLAELRLRYAPVAEGRPEEVIREWTARNVILGSNVEVERGGSTFSGVALDLTPTGALRVDTPGGTVEVTAGDVHLV